MPRVPVIKCVDRSVHSLRCDSAMAGVPESQPLMSGVTAQQKAFSGLDKKKVIGRGFTKWLRFDENGDTTIVSLDQRLKGSLIAKYGVAPRDLRILDPQLATSYPSAILCREKALVVNLEFMR